MLIKVKYCKLSYFMHIYAQIDLSMHNTVTCIRQADQIQYDNCNASAGSGVFRYNGFCFPGNPLIMLTLTQNSQILKNTINFVNNQVYYLTSRYTNLNFCL